MATKFINQGFAIKTCFDKFETINVIIVHCYDFGINDII